MLWMCVEVAALGVLGIAEQRGAGGVGQWQVFGFPGFEAGSAQQLQQLALAQPRIKLPVGAGGERASHCAAVSQA